MEQFTGPITEAQVAVEGAVSSPLELSPQQRTAPKPEAHAWLEPAETFRIPFNPLTGAGLLTRLGELKVSVVGLTPEAVILEPIPICPNVFDPQHLTVRSASATQVKPRPEDIFNG
jgi:hypothetical protein